MLFAAHFHLQVMKNFIVFILIFILTLCAQHVLHAQDAPRLKISLLTCAPGGELYSTFGHSAIRIIDSSAASDVVYNFGTFDFDDPDFYKKFILGKLLYYESVSGMQNFVFDYKAEGRGIIEQEIKLSNAEKKLMQTFLSENLKEENKYYKYDFFLDNCTTRLRDLLENTKSPKPIFPAVMPETFTFRNAIHQYLDQNKKYWSKFGIDLLLGAPTDAVMTVKQQQFLPDNLMLSIDSTTNVELVATRTEIYKPAAISTPQVLFTPMVCTFLLLLTFVAVHWLSQSSRAFTIALNSLDTLLFIVTGGFGCLFLFMMLGTDHIMTKQNWNLLWAIPTHFLAAFFLRSQAKAWKFYFKVVAFGMLALLLLWLVVPQQLNIALIPFVILLGFRSFMAGKRHSSKI